MNTLVAVFCELTGLFIGSQAPASRRPLRLSRLPVLLHF